MPWLYEGHMGGIYADENGDLDTYCETCGESDWPIAYVNSFTEAWEQLQDKIAFNGNGGWAPEYIIPYLCELFPSKASERYEKFLKTCNDYRCEYPDKKCLKLVWRMLECEREEAETNQRDD